MSQPRSRDPFSLVPLLRGPGTTESLTTVLVAFAANLLIAVAKSAAAVVTGSAALVADTESHVAVRLRALEEKFCVSPAVVGAVLSLSAPDEPSLTV